MPKAKPKQEPPIEDVDAIRRMRVERLSRILLLVVLLGIGLLFFWMVKPFLVSAILAAVFSGLFYPLYKWLLKLFRGRKSLSAFMCCLILFLGLLIPIYAVANMVSREAIWFYESAEDVVREIIAQGDSGALGQIKNLELVKKLHLDQIDWQKELGDLAKRLAAILGTVINKASKSTFQLITNLFLTFFAMFYFFRDGDRFIRRFKYLSPLSDRYEEALIQRFINVSKATIKGTLLIGILKGVLGAITFWIFGIHAAALWGVVMVILSIIPMVGFGLVMYPAAIIMIVMGKIWQGVVMLIIGAVVIAQIDNVLQPKLVAKEAGMHDLLIFFSTLGGLSMFGVMGFIIGPIIAAMFVAVIEIYGTEFKSQLDIAQRIGASEPGVTPQPVEQK
ncbi:MAG: AI-2E family transporter [candidate division KSB1 bacterium]|nr:AI-2E family transporter [candidate division KSB1 bacterium]MDZ7334230.1 AI-2E family transporter [candidate division KSB1 bacterium]MDZ7401064.1 AI-2E family transporter [candidate division KSB1 bacterium]